MASDAQLLRVENVSRHFSLPGNQNLPVLNQVSFEMGSGETLAIVGPSGSGKSTLLQIIGTLDKPSSGRVLLDGQDPAQLNEEQLGALRNHQLGFVFQAHYLLPQCSVLENVLVPTLADSRKHQSKAKNPEPESAAVRAKRLLERVGLGQRMQHLPGELSGGE